MYQIPLFNLNFDEAETKAVTDTLASKWISMGPRCEALEQRFREMLHVRYACAVTSCTAALHLACYALGLGPGDEVICPSLTFAATVNCIRYVGATPVFCDVVGNGDLCLDPAAAEALITPRTKAIIPMHFAGYPCDMDAILRLAKAHGLAVIEDACHGPLSEYHGRMLGTIGNVGCFSFFSNKNISSGEGGMLVTNDEALYQRCKLLRSHGMTSMSYQRATGHATSYDIAEIGFNYRLDDIRASIALAQLDKLAGDYARRRQVRAHYERRLGGDDRLAVPFTGYPEPVSNYIFPVVLTTGTEDDRDRIRTSLAEKGVQTSIHYPAAHLFSAYSAFRRPLPNTEYITAHEFTLPMYAQLTEAEVDYVCDCVLQALNELA